MIYSLRVKFDIFGNLTSHFSVNVVRLFIKKENVEKKEKTKYLGISSYYKFDFVLIFNYFKRNS